MQSEPHHDAQHPSLARNEQRLPGDTTVMQNQLFQAREKRYSLHETKWGSHRETLAVKALFSLFEPIPWVIRFHGGGRFR